MDRKKSHRANSPRRVPDPVVATSSACDGAGHHDCTLFAIIPNHLLSKSKTLCHGIKSQANKTTANNNNNKCKCFFAIPFNSANLLLPTLRHRSRPYSLQRSKSKSRVQCHPRRAAIEGKSSDKNHTKQVTILATDYDYELEMQMHTQTTPICRSALTAGEFLNETASNLTE